MNTNQPRLTKPQRNTLQMIADREHSTIPVQPNGSGVKVFYKLLALGLVAHDVRAGRWAPTEAGRDLLAG